jgi:hypothetical protein
MKGAPMEELDAAWERVKTQERGLPSCSGGL